jgi:predicted nucleic acid-binding protein
MKLLADTNVFLEILLEQEKADEARTLLQKAVEHEFFLSDLSLHSIGLLLLRRKLYATFQQFVKDMLFDADVTLINLLPTDMTSVTDAAQRFNLDFDDAYQYAVAAKSGLTLVSFDGDFDRTDRGRKTPAEILTTLPLV